MATFSIEPNERVPFRIRYEDDHLLIVEKPAGVPTQPGRGHTHDTLMNGVFAKVGPKLQKLGRARDFGLLHRLDRQTSGLVVIALDAPTYDALREQFAARGVKKYYWAVVKGEPRAVQGVVRKPILETGGGEGEDTGAVHRPKQARISSAGKPSITAYRVLQSASGVSLLECRPVTGRLHQVRIHLAAVHHPILGDDVYARGVIRGASPRLALHAHRLAFTHPVTGAAIDIRTGWPRDLRAMLKRFAITPPGAGPGSAGGPVERGHEIDGDGIGEKDAAVGEGPDGPGDA